MAKKKDKVTFEQMETARLDLAKAAAVLEQLKLDEIAIKQQIAIAKYGHNSAKNTLNEILNEYVKQ